MRVFPDDLKYTAQHEWIRRPATGDVVRIGITHYAQEALGDVVFVSMPEPGTSVSAGEPVGEVESTKSVSDVYAPVTGTVVTRNDQLEEQPDLVNSDPYGEGWMVEIEVEPGALEAAEGLMDAGSYQEMVEKSD